MPNFTLDNEGNTELHLAVLQRKSIHDFLLIIASHSFPDALAMTTTCNNAGYTPHSLLILSTFEPPYQADEHGQICRLLFGFMLGSSQIAPITQPLNIHEMTREYQESASETLLRNLVIATEVINRTRRLLISSMTHPDTNCITPEERMVLVSRLNISRNLTTINLAHASTTASPLELLRLKTPAHLIFRLGNCNEYTNVSLQVLFQEYPHVRAEKFIVIYGDHGFAVIGRDQNSDQHDYRTWGPNAVVMDAWGGAAYPAYKIPDKLRTYQVYQIPEGERLYPMANILLSFNPHYHKLACDIAYQPVAPLSTLSSLFGNKVANKNENKAPNRLKRARMT